MFYFYLGRYSKLEKVKDIVDHLDNEIFAIYDTEQYSSLLWIVVKAKKLFSQGTCFAFQMAQLFTLEAFVIRYKGLLYLI